MGGLIESLMNLTLPSQNPHVDAAGVVAVGVDEAGVVGLAFVSVRQALQGYCAELRGNHRVEERIAW